MKFALQISRDGGEPTPVELTIEGPLLREGYWWCGATSDDPEWLLPHAAGASPTQALIHLLWLLEQEVLGRPRWKVTIDGLPFVIMDSVAIMCRSRTVDDAPPAE